MTTIRYTLLGLFVFIFSSQLSAEPKDAWFELFKQTHSDEQLYALLHQMPKGGDIHHHITGSNFSEWWWALATDEKRNGGYRYYTKTSLLLCDGVASNEFGRNKSLVLFKTIQHSTYQSLSECKKNEYQPLTSLNEQLKMAWMDSIRLHLPHEGRDEFFERHWARLNELIRNPIIIGEMLVHNMQSYQEEGVRYLETQVNIEYMIKPDGTSYKPQQVLAILNERLEQPDAKATNVVVRFQYMLLRFRPDAEAQLEWIYQFVGQHRDRYVGINMAGREDNDKGYPSRFLPVLRKLRNRATKIPMSIHAGEVDEPNFHVRDTLMLGADRIGHGVNLISDPQTMLLMRNNRYLIEINLISNLLLGYVDDFSQHPFPEYLRTGIPVALSTDDRGMWDSTLTDEFFVAVKAFNLTWSEIKQLSRNSLTYSFVQQETKEKLLDDYESAIDLFEERAAQGNIPLSRPNGFTTRGFICRQYDLCW